MVKSLIMQAPLVTRCSTPRTSLQLAGTRLYMPWLLSRYSDCISLRHHVPAGAWLVRR